MDKVKALLAAGARLPAAIKSALDPMTLTEFAETHGRSLTTMSKVINGAVQPTAADLEALVKQFGGTPDEWRLLIYEQSRPTVAA